MLVAAVKVDARPAVPHQLRHHAFAAAGVTHTRSHFELERRRRRRGRLRATRTTNTRAARGKLAQLPVGPILGGQTRLASSQTWPTHKPTGPPPPARQALAPTRLGGIDWLESGAVRTGAGGERLADVDGAVREVVVATQRDLSVSGFPNLEEGCFLLDGDNGVVQAMLAMAALSGLGAIAVRVFRARTPKSTGWLPTLEYAAESGVPMVELPGSDGGCASTPSDSASERAILL